jgi:diguanylate cyclase (GGDEF)-like protein
LKSSKSSERRRTGAFLGLGLVILGAAGLLAHQPVTTILSAVASHGPAYETLAGLARIRSLVSPPSPANAASSIRREVDGLGASLSEDPGQRERLGRLRDLLRRRYGLAGPVRTGEEERLAREIAALLAEMESEESARVQRMDAAARSSMRLVILVGASAGLVAVLIALLASSLARWEASRRRRTAASVTRLVARQRELADRLDYLDKYDPLTGLPNRRCLVEMLESEIRRARELGRAFSILVTDVNRLRHINDLFGHEAGDEVLKQVAGRLRAVVGERDIVARLGGGEFAVVHLDCSPPIDAAATAEKIQQAVSRSISRGEHDFVVTSTAGIAVYPDHGQDAQTLLRNADLALVKARSQGRNTIQVFDEAMSRSISELFLLERRLFGALENGEYLVHYQPCFALATQEVASAEALLKWNNGHDGVVPASKFVHLLEDTGMILNVGRWVLETACGQIKDWETKKLVLPVAVNLSMVQFRDRGLVGAVADAISGFKLDPAHLTLEVTESVCLQDMEFAIKTLRRLKDMGVSLSIDDFGTGYSSLSYLKRLPVDNIKIDISFVRDVATDQDTASIVSAVTTLARALNLKTIAEGVETEEQRKILHLLRCDMGQGLFFSPAVSAREFESLLV